jgi:ribosomal protein S18 acetylase RimI-like enzyme
MEMHSGKKALVLRFKKTKLFTTHNVCTELQIYTHLSRMPSRFQKLIENKSTLREYSLKLFQKSDRIETWWAQNLVALLCYYRSENERRIFITNVSTEAKFRKMGLAKNAINLLKNEYLGYTIELEVDVENLPAIRLYEKMGFSEIAKGDSVMVMRLEYVQ